MEEDEELEREMLNLSPSKYDQEESEWIQFNMKSFLKMLLYVIKG